MPSTCSVATCKSRGGKEEKISFFTFPKEKALQKIWINKCKRAHNFNIATARICSMHFCADDFDRNLRAELLNLPMMPLLKKNAIPSLNLPTNKSKTISNRTLRREKRVRRQKTKAYIEDIVKTVYPEHCVTKENCLLDLQVNIGDGEDVNGSAPGLNDAISNEEMYKLEVEKLTTENVTLREKLEKLSTELRKAKKTYNCLITQKNSVAPKCGLAKKCKSIHLTMDSPINIKSEIEIEDYAITYHPSSILFYNNDINREDFNIKSENLSQDTYEAEENQTKSSCNAEDNQTQILESNNLDPTIKIEEIDEVDNDREMYHVLLSELPNEETADCSTSDELLLEQNEQTSFNDEEKDCEERNDEAELSNRKNTKHKQVQKLKSSNENQTSVNKKEKDCEEKLHGCKLCTKQYKQARNLSFHMKSHTDEKSFTCEICSKMFWRADHLKNHLVTHSELKPHACKLCDKQFKYPSTLAKHVREHNDEKPFICEICNKGFWRANYLKDHLVIHSGLKPYTCNLCNHQFTNTTILLRHMKQHTSEKSFTCEICNKAFWRAEHLKNHSVTHTGLNPYACKLCNKQFKYLSTLSRHEREEHNSEKRFTCETCNKAFWRAEHLKNHMVAHSGLKPYVCKVCNKQFNHASTLSSHMRIHTGEMPFTCEICSKAFMYSVYLKRHMEVHSGIKSFECKLCAKQFTTSTGLARHNKNNHV